MLPADVCSTHLPATVSVEHAQNLPIVSSIHTSAITANEILNFLDNSEDQIGFFILYLVMRSAIYPLTQQLMRMHIYPIITCYFLLALVMIRAIQQLVLVKLRMM